MRYRYYTLDVFTATRFGGNPLAVLPEAEGLSTEQMQAITREFNYSESTFVLTPEDSANDARVRIFSPNQEMPFAGHPNIGTAYLLSLLAGSNAEHETTLRFEEVAGRVPVRVRWKDGAPAHCELSAPQALELGPAMDGADDTAELARALGLDNDDIVTDTHFPQRASVGLPFLCVELRDLEALDRARLRIDRFADYAERAGSDSVHLYTRDTGTSDADIRCRMYATLGSLREDPATGSANCALAGLLASAAPDADGTFRYRIAQGMEMGRPSELLASVDKCDGAVTEVRIGGACVMVADGTLEAG